MANNNIIETDKQREAEHIAAETPAALSEGNEPTVEVTSKSRRHPKKDNTVSADAASHSERRRRKPGKANPAALTKSEMVLKKLRTAKGATIGMMMDATGWQAHSVRGFLSGTVKKKLGLTVTSEIGKDGERHYRISNGPEN
jgi:hypothetical protein